MNGSLVRSSHVPQAPFFSKSDVPGILWTCNNPVEGFLRAAGAFFFGKNDVPGFFTACSSPVEVFLRAAGAFFPAKMMFLDFLGHVIALLRSSYLPQAFSFRQTVTRKWLWLYL